jgi:hypothetical protein
MEFMMMARAASPDGVVKMSLPAVAEETEGGSSTSYFAREQMKAGKALLDCGATHSIGSLEALDLLAQANLEKHGDPRVDVSTNHRPWYQFGDGERKQCVTQSVFGVHAREAKGKCPINGLDVPGIPILVAIEALARMGAVVDFECNVGCFKNIDPTTIVKFEKQPPGHLYMSLVDDLLEQETTDPKDVEKLVPFARRVLEIAGAGAGARPAG